MNPVLKSRRAGALSRSLAASKAMKPKAANLKDKMIGRKMKFSSNPPVTGVPESNTKDPEKDQEKTEVKEVKKTKQDIAAQIIQYAWFSYIDKTIFKLLKHTICAAEHFVTYEILKKVSPLEAKLIKDPAMKCRVRFRFSGEKFPPFIVFKIFLHTEGHGYKYISGKNIMKASREAMVGAYNMMGEKQFLEQILEDQRLFHKFKITDEIDIITLKDYMKYTSLMDEIPARSGGRNNHWRRLNLENFPRTTIMYDIVDYAESGTLSARLQKEIKFLTQKPKTEEMRQHQLQIVSAVRSPSPSLTIMPLYRPYKKETQMKHLGRRSKKAQRKVEKMRKAYTKESKQDATPVTEPKISKPRILLQEIVVSTPAFDIVRYLEMSDEELGKRKKELYVWSQGLYCMKSPPS